MDTTDAMGLDIDKLLKQFPITGKNITTGIGKTGLNPFSMALGVENTMMDASIIDLAETNKRLPNVDPFAVPKYGNNDILTQIKKKLFAFGGTTNGSQEVEGDEIVQTPNGFIGKVKGPKHEQGGVQTNLPDGTKIFSDRIEVDNRTLAQRKLDRENKLKKLKEKLKKDKSDTITKNALNRVEQTNKIQEYYDTQFEDIVNKAVNANVNPNNEKFAYGTSGTNDNPPPDWTNPNYAKTALAYLNEDNFKEFTDFYQRQMSKPYNQTYNNFVTKVNEATADKNLVNNRIKENIYGKTYYTEDNKTSNNEISTMPNIGLFGKILDNGYDPNNFGLYNTKELSFTNPLWVGGNKENIEGVGTPKVIDNSGQPPTDGSQPNLNPNPNPAQTFTKNLNNYIGTMGDAIGGAGTLLGMLGPGMVTLKNRLGDLPNTSPYKQYGEKGLDSNEEAAKIDKSLGDEYLRDIDLYGNGAMKKNRDSARTINVQRALDTVTHMQTLKAREGLTKNLLQSMGQLQSQKTGLLNQQDKVRMTGEAQADLANRQDRDAFYTNINKDINTSSTYLQKEGRDMNANAQNRLFLDILPTLSKYGFKFIQGSNGQWQMADKNGNVMNLDQQGS